MIVRVDGASSGHSSSHNAEASMTMPIAVNTIMWNDHLASIYVLSLAAPVVYRRN